ncbi:MAG: DMT family transporter [Candidatus Limnocylindrales bacterium]
MVLGSAALFGTLGPLSRFAYEAGLTPLGFTTWRALLGGALVGSFVLWRASRGGALVDLRRIPRRQQAALATAALASMVLNLAIFTAFDRISVALALLGFYTYPALLALAISVIHRERLGRGKLIALTLASTGMALVLLGQLGSAAGVQFDGLGFALALLAAGAQVVNVLVSRRGYRAVPTGEATSVILVSGGLSYLLIALLLGRPEVVAGPLAAPAALPFVLAAGIFGAGIPSLGFLTGIRWIGGVRTGILMLFEPVIGVLLAALLLDERLAPLQLLGGALVIAAGVLLQRIPEPAVAHEVALPDVPAEGEGGAAPAGEAGPPAQDPEGAPLY